MLGENLLESYVKLKCMPQNKFLTLENENPCSPQRFSFFESKHSIVGIKHNHANLTSAHVQWKCTTRTVKHTYVSLGHQVVFSLFMLNTATKHGHVLFCTNPCLVNFKINVIDFNFLCAITTPRCKTITHSQAKMLRKEGESSRPTALLDSNDAKKVSDMSV